MKKFLLLAAASLGLGFAANAQDVNLDLIEVIFPKSNTNYPNKNTGDTVILSWVFKNNGTEALLPTDTIKLSTSGWFLDTPGFSLTLTEGGISLAPGASDTLSFYYVDGISSWDATNSQNQPITIKAKTPYNSVVTDTITHFIYGQRGGAEFPSDSVEYTGTEISKIAVSNILGSLNFSFGTVSIDKIVKSTSLNVYPNPANTTINFSYEFATAQNATARVYDLMGRTVLTQDFGKQAAGVNNFTIDIATLSNGVYYIEMVNGDNRGISKFTVSK